jgi:biopolymer transport protein ExbB
MIGLKSGTGNMPSLFVAGGIVMVPLLVLSMVTGALAVERCWFWLRLGKQQRALVHSVLEAYRKSPPLALAKVKQYPHVPIARIFLTALTIGDTTPEEFRLALESAAQAEIPLLKRFQTVFETTIGIAPLLGLLGTVLGLIRVLSNIQLGETSPAAADGVTLGVGEALISTAAGLLVAIVALVFANVFQGLYRRQRAFIQEACSRLEILHRRYLRQASGALGNRGAGEQK